jgi:hypothetical protein
MSRTALLIRGDVDEAQEIRAKAALQRRTISAYVLQVLMRRVQSDDLTGRRTDIDSLKFVRLSDVPRTAVLVRCDREEAARIPDSARVATCESTPT